MAKESAVSPVVASPGGDRPDVRKITAAVVLLLLALPMAAWMDLRSLTQRSLEAQAKEIGREIDAFRAYYANEVVARLAEKEPTKPVHNFRDQEKGFVPIPATLSLDLGERISRADGSVRYRFISEYPFKGRARAPLDEFERGAIERLRYHPDESVWETKGGLGDQTVRMATPILMTSAKCVACHNEHPDSPRKDWRLGDVRGIQEITIERPIETSVWTFKWMLGWFLCAAATGAWFVMREQRQQAVLRTLSAKLARYLSPQLFRSIFRGEIDVKVATTRKKLTIFFSDIVDFTGTTERLQPEEITTLLNEYLTEMSAIATRHGGTIDKFIGDAIVVFFGDPETAGVKQDAVKCLRMAVEMQRRLESLNAKWRGEGVEHPFRVRMGINTGYCNVGNFGSEDRIEYTIIGAEANLSARLQSVCEPGGIVLSHETFVLVRDIVRAHPLPAMTLKGFHRSIVPYAVDGLVGESEAEHPVVTERAHGLDVFVDTSAIRDADAPKALAALRQAVAALERRSPPPPPP